MKKSLSLFLAVLAVASAASASDAVSNNNHKHYVKTSRAAQCGTPSGKTSKECAQLSSAQSPREKAF